MGLALTHPEQPPLHDLEGRGLQVDQEKQEPILRRGQGTVRVGGIPTRGARSSIETPLGHMGLVRGLKGGNERLKLSPCETGQVE
jgi:hypothetical protein